MASNVVRVYRSGSDLDNVYAAPAPSNGWYFVENPTGSEFSSLARIDSDGTIAWQKKISFGTEQGYAFTISSATHVAFLFSYGAGPYSLAVHLYDSSGTLVWETLLPMDWYKPDRMALDGSNNLYLFGQLGTSSETILVKLAGADGTVSWSVNLRGNGLSDIDRAGPVVVMSGGDPVVAVLGPPHTSGTGEVHVQRLSATDGSVVWSKGVVWDQTTNEATGLAVDPSDNIYAWCKPFTVSAVDAIDVLKLQSDGTTRWSRRAVIPSGFAAYSFTLDWTGLGVGTADGLHIPMLFGNSAGVDNKDRCGHLFMPAAGTVGAGNAKLITYNDGATPSVAVAPTMTGMAGAVALAYRVQDALKEARLVRSTHNSGEDSTWGTTTRTTFLYDIVSATSASSTQTFTLATNPSFSASAAATETIATATLLTEAFGAGAFEATATGIASTLTFGLPYIRDIVTGIAPTTAFGTPTYTRGQPATGIASALAFGTVDIQLSYNVTSLAPSVAFGTVTYSLDGSFTASGFSTTAFGTPWAERGVAPQPAGAVRSIAPALAFGLPTAIYTELCTAEGFSTTVIPEPIAQLGQSVTGLAAVTAFGTPMGTFVCVASGFSATALGLPSVGQFGYCTSLLSTLRFGAPAIDFAQAGTTTGIASTVTFGTPASNAPAYARGSLSRTRFGLPQTFRTGTCA